MADLDIFFAKKDKKKVKGRKYDNPDEIAKRLKESEKKLEKEFCKIEPVKKTLDDVLSTTSSNSGNEPVAAPEPKPEKIKEEEEWKDFLEESQKDLTNLKISKLQIEDEEDGVMGYGSGDDDGGTGTGNKSDGVWNKNVERQEADPAPDVETVVPVQKDDAKTQGPGGSYVPPHLRNMSASPLPRGAGGYRKPKTAPDITNAMAFPSLSDSKTAAPASAWGRKKVSHNDDHRGFESVKHGSTRAFTEDYAPPKLSTANRFDALSDNS